MDVSWATLVRASPLADLTLYRSCALHDCVPTNCRKVRSGRAHRYAHATLWRALRSTNERLLTVCHTPTHTPVEDPSENFQDMRDKLDLRMLVESGEFESFDSMPFSKGEAEPIRQKFKLAEVSICLLDAQGLLARVY